MTPNITREQLDAYIDDMLSESETALVEQRCASQKRCAAGCGA